MLYKFKSKSAADVIMMGPNGDRVLEALGRSPSPKGILQAPDLPSAIATLEQAIERDDAQRRQAEEEAQAEGRPPPKGDGVTLRQRAWPLVEMMRRAQAQGHDVVWGV